MIRRIYRSFWLAARVERFSLAVISSVRKILLSATYTFRCWTAWERPWNRLVIAQNHFQSANKNQWQSYVTVAAVACLPIGLLWDISWHISIGRDTFWAPAHIVIQLGGIVPALLFAWQ